MAMSSSKPDKLLDFNRSTLHPVISIFLPLFFFINFTFFLGAVFGESFRIHVVFYIFLFLAGLEEAVAGNILFKESEGGMARLRELVYLIIVVLIVVLILQKGNLAERWQSLIKIQNLYMILLVPVQWLVSFVIHRALREREILLISLKGIRGDELRSTLRQNSEMVIEAMSGLKKVKLFIIFFQTIVFILLILYFVLGTQISGLAVIFLVLHAAAGIIFTIVINNAVEDQLLSGEGVVVGPLYRRRRFILALSVLFLVVLLIFFFARSTSLLPLSLFQPLLDWLARRPSREASPPVYQRKSPEQGMGDMLKTLGEMGQAEPNKFFRILFFILGRILLGVVVTAVIYFLISPFLSRYFRGRLKMFRPAEVLWRKINAFLSYLGRLVEDFWTWLKRSGSFHAQSRKLEREARRWKQLKNRQPGWLKKLEMGRILKGFLKLMRWGQKKGVLYKKHMGPAEYTGMLSDTVPPQREALTEAVDIMEEALFSSDLLKRGKLARYLFLVKRIVKEKKEKTA
jgi:hypothetical protein